jgi:hypothetical protein
MRKVTRLIAAAAIAPGLLPAIGYGLSELGWLSLPFASRAFVLIGGLSYALALPGLLIVSLSSHKLARWIFAPSVSALCPLPVIWFFAMAFGALADAEEGASRLAFVYAALLIGVGSGLIFAALAPWNLADERA